MNFKPETWILNGILCTQDSHRSVRRAHIRVIDGRISEIQSELPQTISPDATVIDASGLTLIPGFIHAHVHLCQTLFRNQADDLELLDWLSKKIWVMEGAHTEETLYTSALLGIYELLSSGATCILDMATVRHTHAVLEAVRDTGIRANVGKCLMDNPEQNPVYLRESTRDALKEATSLYEKWHGCENDRIRVSFAPRFAISCTHEILKEVAQLSRHYGAIIHTHASENLSEIELVRKLSGRENIEYFHHLGMTSQRLVLAHCVWLNDIEKNLLLESGSHVVHCPSSNLKLASGIASVPQLSSLGINVALGADGAPCNNNLNMFQEMRLAALIHKPGGGPKTLRAMEALDMGTRNGAKALGWHDSIGSIEVGKKADLVGLNLNTPSNSFPIEESLNPEMIASSIVYSSQPCHVKWTMVEGKVLYSDGKVHAVSEDTLMKRVYQALRHFRPCD